MVQKIAFNVTFRPDGAVGVGVVLIMIGAVTSTSSLETDKDRLKFQQQIYTHS